MPSRSILLFCLTLAVSLVLWIGGALRLRHSGALDFDPNVAALNGSPYGKTLALFMEGPVNTYWHAESGGEHHHAPGEECGACKHEQELENSLIARLEETRIAPNTPYGIGPAHKKYLYRQILRKLQTAYAMDPTNYANFSALFLFLSETSLGLGQADPQVAIGLAERTRAQAERENINPEPWLTAATAMHGKLVTLLQTRHGSLAGSFQSNEEIEKTLKDFGFCLSRYELLRKTAVETGRWAAFPAARREAMEERHKALSGFLRSQTSFAPAIFRDTLSP